MSVFESNADYPLTVLTGDNSRGRILSVLVEADEPLSQSEIADRADVSQAGVSRSISGLVEHGVVRDVDGTWGYELDGSNPVADMLVGVYHEL